MLNEHSSCGLTVSRTLKRLGGVSRSSRPTDLLLHSFQESILSYVAQRTENREQRQLSCLLQRSSVWWWRFVFCLALSPADGCDRIDLCFRTLPITVMFAHLLRTVNCLDNFKVCCNSYALSPHIVFAFGEYV